MNLATSNNSLIKYSNLYDLSSAMPIYLFLCSCGISFISLNNDKYPIIDVNGVFMSCARYTINSSFFCSFSLASLSFFIASVLKWFNFFSTSTISGGKFIYSTFLSNNLSADSETANT